MSHKVSSAHTLVPIHSYQGERPHLVDVWLNDHAITELRKRQNWRIAVLPPFRVIDIDPRNIPAGPVEYKVINLALSWSPKHNTTMVVALNEPEEVLEWAKVANARYWDDFWR